MRSFSFVSAMCWGVPTHSAYLLYDRSRISQKNKWLDEEKRVFAIFQLDKLSKESGICQTSTKKALKELSENGLLIRKSVGFSKPKHLYVLLPDKESYIRGKMRRMRIRLP